MKAMGKIKRGGGFAGVAKYGLERDGQLVGELIGGNMIGDSLPEITAEFNRARVRRREVEKPVWHSSLRLPEGERIDNGTWCEIADDYMSRLGFTDEHQRIYVLHDDPDGQHVHIIANRINSVDGSLYLGQNENLKSTEIVRELEKEYGLRETIEQKRDKRAPKKPELERAKRTGEDPVRIRLQGLIDEAKAGKPDIITFVRRLNEVGVDVGANVSPTTGRMSGMSFKLDGNDLVFKGSALGARYAWKQLSTEVEYDREKHQAALSGLETEAGINPGVDVDAGRKVDDLHVSRDENADAHDGRNQNNPTLEGGVRGEIAAGAGGASKDAARSTGTDTGTGADEQASGIRDHARGVRHHESGGVRPAPAWATVPLREVVGRLNQPKSAPVLDPVRDHEPAPEPAKPAHIPAPWPEPTPAPSVVEPERPAWTPPPAIVLTDAERREEREAYIAGVAHTAAAVLQNDTGAKGDRGVYAHVWRGNRAALAHASGVKVDEYKDFERLDFAVADELTVTTVGGEYLSRARIASAIAQHSPAAAARRARGEDPAQYAKKTIEELDARRQAETARAHQENEMRARIARLGGHAPVQSSGPSFGDGPRR